MLIKKDTNALSAPNFFSRDTKRNSDTSHNNDKRKPILKKNANQLHTDQLYNHSDKQNLPHSKQKMAQFNEVGSSVSSEFMRRIQNKKKSIFLELDQLQNSSKRKDRINSKNISFLSIASSECGGGEKRKFKQNYKQSRVDIIFSNSNIQESFWNNQSNHQIDFDLPQKSFKNLQSSEVVQVQLHEPTSIKLQFKKAHLYEVKKSDRIIEDSDAKREKKLQKVKTADKTLSLKSNPFSTSSSNFFKKTSYYDLDSQSNEGKGTCFTIKQTPPPTEQIIKHCKQQKLKTGVQNSGSGMKLGLTNQSSLYRKRVEEAKNKIRQTLKESVSSESLNLLVTLNPVSSKVLPQSVFRNMSVSREEFHEDFFQKINSYRFLNRLCYKVRKYMELNVNRKSYEELVAQMQRVKCFTLLNAELDLQTLDSFQNRSENNNINEFLLIVQNYIEKERKQKYWRHVETEFLRVTNSPFSLNDKIVAFLEQTLPQVENQLKLVLPELEKNLRTMQNLEIQLRFKIVKHLFYDVVKMNFFQYRQLPVSLKGTKNRKERLIELIEKDEWFEKVPFTQIDAEFHQLKVDFRHLSR